MQWGNLGGAFPACNRRFLVTEINRDWVDEMALAVASYASGTVHAATIARP